MEEKAQPYRYTDLEKQELIEQWRQSGKSKASFAKKAHSAIIRLTIGSGAETGKRKSQNHLLFLYK